MGKIVGFGLLGLVFSIFVGIFMAYVGAFNNGNVMEQNIVAAYDNNRNILAQYQQKVIEASQVSEFYANDLKEVVSAALEGRYGTNGAKAVFQAISEQNPNVDSAVYLKIQQIIDSGRKDFEVAQTRLIDNRRIYQTNLGYFWTGTMLKFAGYPKIDLSKYDIVTTANVEQTFETKKEEPLKLR